jgi:hypothetical protein
MYRFRFRLVNGNGCFCVPVKQAPLHHCDDPIHAFEAAGSGVTKKHRCRSVPSLRDTECIGLLPTFQRTISSDNKFSCWSPEGHRFFEGVRPASPIKQTQGHSAPFEVVRSARVIVNFDSHHDSIRLLDLPDAAELNAVAEPNL